MRIHMKRLACTLCLLLLAAGCVQGNAIKLTYALNGSQAPCSGDVTVFKFEDKRPAANLGKDNDLTPITTLSDVADWVGWALFDELKSAGCEPKYRTSTVTPGEGLLVTGEVLAVELNQSGATTYKGKVSVKVMVQKGGETLRSEKYTSEVEDIVVPGYSSESDIMAEALRGVMSEIVPMVAGLATN